MIEQFPGINTVMPTFTLPAAAGGEVNTWRYKQRQSLVLLFYRGDRPEAAAYLRALAERYAALRDEDAEVLAIAPEPVDRLRDRQRAWRVPFPLLADPGGIVIPRFTRWDATRRELQPALYIADRFGAVYARFTADDEGGLPAPEDIRAELAFIAIQCPE
jgi:peroxiredoxin